MLAIPYTGSGVLGSALAMDKAVMKLYSWVLDTTPSYVICRTGDDVTLPLPFVVKPAREGSTIGISIVRSEEEKEPSTVATIPRSRGRPTPPLFREITAGHRCAAVMIFPDHNHLFQLPDGLDLRIRDPATGPDELVLRAVADWLSAAEPSAAADPARHTASGTPSSRAGRAAERSVSHLQPGGWCS